MLPRVTSPSAIAVLVLCLGSSPSAHPADCGRHRLRLRALPRGPPRVRRRPSATSIISSRASPRDLKALNLMGIALTGAGRRDAANERFEAALAIDPRFYPARKNLAVNEYDAGRVGKARAHFESVLKIVPADEVANLYMGEILYAGKNLRQAFRTSRRAAIDTRRMPVLPCITGGASWKRAERRPRSPSSTGSPQTRGRASSRPACRSAGPRPIPMPRGSSRRPDGATRTPTRPATTRR